MPGRTASLRYWTASTWSVAATFVVTLFAAALRLTHLDRIPALIFDETYYVKDAWSLRQLGYEGVWDEAALEAGVGAAGDLNAAFAAGNLSALQLEGAFIAHPPLGKWLISLGMTLLGQADPVGWRLASALAGALGVALLMRLAWVLFKSVPLMTLAGLFLATDGMHLVMSRTGLLDIFLSTFVVGAFWGLAHDLAGGARGWWRPWLLVAGVFLGAATATKWSGLYAGAAVGLVVVGREMWEARGAALDSGGGRVWLVELRAALRGGVLGFTYLLAPVTAVYLASWFSWFKHPAAWGHAGIGSGAAEVVGSWWGYQQQIWGFHHGLEAEHPYQSSPAGWLLQLRPTSFWYSAKGGTVETVLALGNPALWWLAMPGLVVLAVATFGRPRWQYAVVWAGFAGLYLPWFAYPGRTMFTFYTVAFAPFVALVVAWLLVGLAGGPGRPEGPWAWARKIGAGALVAAVLVSAWWFLPIWTGAPIPQPGWEARMLLRGWI